MDHETLLLQSTPVRPDRGGKQVEEAPQQKRYGAERGVWTENMLIALERGIEGNKWFSLIDKVVSARTLGIAWKKVQTNAGACGVDCITVRHFSKDSQNRLLAVREQIREGRYQPKLIRRVYIPKPGSNEQRGDSDGDRSSRTERAEDGHRAHLRMRICDKQLWLQTRTWL
ncbi:MAG: hypothetical protein R3F19_31960 [Verrucomicrobiales bacterium]